MSTGIIVRKRIESKILSIRGQKVMLDRDIAELYGVETRVLNQAVRRNKDRFPKDFVFSLSRREIMNLSQTVISSRIKHAPNVFAFTEQGVAMCSSVLKSKRAVLVNVAIMRAFVKLREMLMVHKELEAKLNKLEKKVEGNSEAIHVIFEAIRRLMKEEEGPKNKIGF